MRNFSGDRRGGRGGGRGRGGNRYGRGGRGGGGGRNRGGGGRNPREASLGGNQRERIAVESGQLIFIDQFMLANPQFIEKIIATADDTAVARDEIVSAFGGVIVNMAPGTYKIDRDPFALRIVIYPDGQESGLVDGTATNELGTVFVDTRCLAMIDRELLDDTDLLMKYQQLWFAGEEKACRDLLRDNGGAVRYGFDRYGDELIVKFQPDRNVVALGPTLNLAEATATSESHTQAETMESAI